MDTGEKALLFTLIGVFALLMGSGFIAEAIDTPREVATEVADILCADRGFADSIEDHGAYYCVSYGHEPRIERAGTVVELVGE